MTSWQKRKTKSRFFHHKLLRLCQISLSSWESDLALTFQCLRTKDIITVTPPGPGGGLQLTTEKLPKRRDVSTYCIRGKKFYNEPLLFGLLSLDHPPTLASISRLFQLASLFLFEICKTTLTERDEAFLCPSLPRLFVELNWVQNALFIFLQTLSGCT